MMEENKLFRRPYLLRRTISHLRAGAGV